MPVLFFRVSQIRRRPVRRAVILASLPIIAVAWLPYAAVVAMANGVLGYVQAMIGLARSIGPIWNLPEPQDRKSAR